MEILFLVASLLIFAGWIFAEARGLTVLRRILGALAIISASLVGLDQGRALGQLNANHWYQSSSKRLLEEIADNMEPETREAVIIKSAIESFRPTYEDREEYEILVQSITERLHDQPRKPEAGNGE